MTKNYPDVQLMKYEQYSEIFQALKDKRGDAILSDNTELIAWAKDNPGFKVGVATLGSQDTIAPAVTKGNKELLGWINNEFVTLVVFLMQSFFTIYDVKGTFSFVRYMVTYL